MTEDRRLRTDGRRCLDVIQKGKAEIVTTFHNSFAYIAHEMKGD